jgi:hypothetical protein
LRKLGGQIRIILKRIFNNQSVRCGMHWSDSGQRATVACIEHENEAIGCRKVDNFWGINFSRMVLPNGVTELR